MSNLLFIKMGPEANLKTGEQPTFSCKKYSSAIRQSMYAVNQKQIKRQVGEQKNQNANTCRDSQNIFKNEIKNKLKNNLSGLPLYTNIKMLDSMESEGIFNQLEQNRRINKMKNDHSLNQNSHLIQSIYSSLDQISMNQPLSKLSKQVLIKAEKKQEQKRKSLKKNQSNAHMLRQKYNQQQVASGKSHKMENKQSRATKQLIEQQNNIQVQQNPGHGNEKLEGWVIKNTMKNFYTTNHDHESMRVNHSSSSSTSPHSKKQLMNDEEMNKHFYFSPSNGNKNSKVIKENSRNTISRPGSKNHRTNNQITTSQFLKQLKLKYAKIAQQKCEQGHHKNAQLCHNRMHSDQNNINYVAVNNHQRNKTQDILIEEDAKSKSFINYENSRCNFCLVNVNARQDENNQKFIKYSNIRIYKKVKANAQEHLKHIKTGTQKFRQKVEKKDNQKVHYEGLLHRPDQRSKSRLNFNIQSQERNMTIDPSQLSYSRLNNNEYIGYVESKKKRTNFRKQFETVESKKQNNNRLSRLNLVDKNAEGLEIINNQIEYNAVEQKNKLIKIKLKYLKNLKVNPNTNLNTIEAKNIERAKIMPQIGSLKKINYHSENIIKGNISTRNHTEIPWEERITARGGEDFQRLKQLLKKQQGEAVYLLFERERASKNCSEMKNRNQHFYKLNTANNNI